MDKRKPATLPLIPGYRVEAKLGEGGMGAVYRAVDERLGRHVAVKVLASHLGGDAHFLERFQREARYLARVRHPNLVTIYDVVSAGALPYLVMEYVQGGTLGDRLKAGKPFPWAEAEPLLDGILAAVEAIHAAGLVHRDLKPGNILLAAGNQPKVMDFGLAKDPSAAALTQEGMLLGTPEYMSPEQALGDAAGPPSDVYAVGVIAYEMLSGTPPFRGVSSVETLRLQCKAEPRPLTPGLAPTDAEAWLRRALAKDPKARFADAGAMRRALTSPEAAPAGGTTVVDLPAPDPVRPMASPRRIWAAAGALAVLALLAGALLLGRRTPAGPRVTLETGGKTLHGELIAIEDGGARIRLKVDGKERTVALPAGQAGELRFDTDPTGGTR